MEWACNVSQQTRDARARQLVREFVETYPAMTREQQGMLAGYLDWRGYEAVLDPSYRPGEKFRVAIEPSANEHQVVRISGQ